MPQHKEDSRYLNETEHTEAWSMYINLYVQGDPFALVKVVEYFLDKRHGTQAQKSSPWRLIETAPKDGTEILITGGTYYYDASISAALDPYTGVKIACWEGGASNDADCWNGGYGSEYDGEYWHEPTHWMPLPARPNTEEGKV